VSVSREFANVSIPRVFFMVAFRLLLEKGGSVKMGTQEAIPLSGGGGVEFSKPRADMPSEKTLETKPFVAAAAELDEATATIADVPLMPLRTAMDLL